MPDIKTALATALKEWEPPAEGTVIDVTPSAPAPKTKRNMTRDCFIMVRDNPGITRNNAVDRLAAMGHKPQSTTSILSQMVKAKMITEVGHGILSTKRKNYTPLKPVKNPAPKAVQPSVAAPQPEPTPTPAPAFTPAIQRVSEGDVGAWVNALSLKDARDIYVRLHTIFGAHQ